ncbi:hypothetical protein VP01_1220g6 [Puccinia sorghi]|uniref:Uncharacterized protein n=1 Tax=Puccinia sorghi TaxID=27349 RepID=A0A0L6VQ34_9BASI|nr:hypothetical protein VP01_1220g6 [Puccinia sorghi]
MASNELPWKLIIHLHEEVCPPTPPSPCSAPPAGHLETPYLNDLPSLTPSKLAASVSDSDSDSIPERFTDDDEDLEEGPAGLLDALSLVPTPAVGNETRQPLPPAQRTPSSQTSLGKIGRKRSLSALVALRYRGGKGDSEIGDEERGLLALDLDTYINSGEPEIPETRALPPSALFPTLSAVLPGTTTGKAVTNTRRFLGVPLSPTTTTTTTTTPTTNKNQEEEEVPTDLPQTPGLTITLHPDSLLVPTPRSEWPFGGGTGPGKTSRGFIPGRSLNLLSPTTDSSVHCAHSPDPLPGDTPSSPTPS